MLNKVLVPHSNEKADALHGGVSQNESVAPRMLSAEASIADSVQGVNSQNASQPLPAGAPTTVCPERGEELDFSNLTPVIQKEIITIRCYVPLNAQVEACQML